MRGVPNAAYALAVRLHPREFRADFGEEMLWIFDEHMRGEKGGAARLFLCMQLLLEGLRSACIQRAFREQKEEGSYASLFSLASSSACALHLPQGSLVVFCMLFSILTIALSLKMMLSSF